MKTNIRNLIDLKKVDALLEGFNKSTGFVTAILDLEGNILSKSGWRPICTEFHRINPETSKRCTISDTMLANKMEKSEKYHAYKCMNGLMDVAVPIKINGEHVANLFCSQFFFEKPDIAFFKEQAKEFGFDEKKYLDALSKVPVVSEEKAKTAIDFLLNMTEIISDLAIKKLEQAELNQELKNSEARYKAIFESTGTATLIIDEDTTILLANNECLNITGYTSAELIGRRWTNYVAKENLQEMLKNHQLRRKNTKLAPLKYEVKLLNSKGGKRDAVLNINMIPGTKQSVVSMLDITERKQAVEEHRKNESNLEEYFENDISAAYLVSVSGEIFSCNKTFLNLFGFEKKSETEKFDITELYKNPEERKQVIRLVKKQRKVENHEVEFISKEGKTIYALMNVIGIFGKDDKLEKIRGYLVDITEQKNIEKELYKSEEKYRLLFANNPQPMWIYDLETLAFLEVNQAAVYHYGYSKEEFLTMTLKDIRPAEDIPALLEDIKNTRLEYNKAGEWRHLKKNGEIINVEIISHSVLFNERKARHILVNDITQRKFFETELLKVSRAVEQSPVSVIITGLDGNVEYVNPKTLEITGYTKEELIGKNPRIFSSGEKPKSKYQQIWNTISSGKEWFGEFHNKKKNGELYWESASISPIFNEKREIINYVAVKEDITERKKVIVDLKIAKEKAEESEGKLKEAQRIAHMGNWELNIETNKLFWSDEIYRIFDCQPQEFNATYEAFLEFIHPDDREEVNSAYLNSLETKIDYQIEHRLITKNNQLKYVREKCRTTFNKQGIPLNSIGIVIDITEQKALENELINAKEKAEESEQRFKSLIENAPDGVVILNESGKFIYGSPNAARLFGYNINEVIGHSGDEYTHPDDLPFVLKTIETIINNPMQKPTVNYRFRRKNGEYRWIETTFTNLLSDKAINGIILNFTDVTERRQILEDLVTAKEKAEESDRLKSAFLANMSHEIRTPMNGILGFTDLLLNPDLSSEEKESYIEIVHKSGHRMLNTVNDIVEISKIEAGLVQLNLTETDVNGRMKELIRFFQPEAEKKGIKLSLEMHLPTDDKIIKTDQNKFDSILSNLIKNAIKYTESGTIKMGCRQKDRFIEFYIKDTGIGIPTDRIEAIFNRFVQADIEDKRVFEGSGLGLAIAKSYVEMLGGNIWVESIEGNLPAGKAGGTTFYFTLPAKYNIEEKSTE